VSPLVLVLVALAGGAGAVSRFVLDAAVSSRRAEAFPWGTFVVNLLGALLLEGLVGATVSEPALRVAGLGAIGSFTTFSTWMLESHRLAEEGQGAFAALNLLASLACGLLALWLGRQLGAWL
jgi:CrcB protein